ncbi:MAG: endonuclease III [Bacteroidales bacterium]|nr:endonuclease III [Bacteroidales bacterium]MDE6831349.1 endonuclease III [Muribaculaceae bacterium]
MTSRQRYKAVIEWFEASMPVAETELHFDTTFHLLVAVILSAQCTDKRVNMITPPLFEAYPTPESMAASTVEEIFEYIRSVSYPNNKARNLLAAARMITEEFGGEIPSDMDSLLRIPGVGRKTANVMLAVAFDRQAMPVDTHVFRVSERLGLTTGSRTPLETERTLVSNIPADKLSKAHHWLILHGRYVCKARRPDCLNCGLKPFCRYYSKS